MRFPRRRAVCITGLLWFAICYPPHASALLEVNRPDSGSPAASSHSGSGDSIEIPGPLRSFLRMAAISQEAAPDEVVPALARNVSLYGYASDKPKEYLILLERYVQFARDLRGLANENGTIRITGCQDAGNLLEALGYKLQRECGRRDTALMTANAERAFLTIDSGFPLTTLEHALQMDGPFTYAFPATRVPIILHEKDWLSAGKWKQNRDNNLLDLLLHDPHLDRLYTALARCDDETRIALNGSPGLRALMPHAAVMDLYGSQITIKSGHVIVPGDAEKSWQELVGESPHSPGPFVDGLLTKDSGWLSAYFDALSRLNPTEQAHVTQGNLLRRFYNAYRSTAMKADASRGVYPINGNLVILLASLRWKPDGDLDTPGELSVWNDILSQVAKSREIKMWMGRERDWNTTGKLLDTLIAASNYRLETGPVEIFLILSAIDSARPPERQLSRETEILLAHRFSEFSRWFPIFAEFPALDDSAIKKFVSAADRVGGISNSALRSNALGSFQADVGLWQIFARQGQIPADQLNSTWQKVVEPFLGVSSSIQLFEASRASLQASLQAVAGKRDLSQDETIDLLAGPAHDDRDSQRVHQEMADRIHAVLDDQRLASLDTLFGLYDGMTEMSHGASTGSALLPLAESLREFELPRPIFSGTERASWAPPVYTSRHTELQVRTDLTKILKSPASPSQLEAARGQLTPFLRDTLVGLNYAYYEPPGAQVLHNNPLFVRSHDFSSISVQGFQEIWGAPRLVGVGATAGGGAYLLGSLADLPYALANTEADFIVPKNIQALIWRDVVPHLLVGATQPRWWNVSKNELHLAALYQRAGEELLTASANNPELRSEVTTILSDRMTPVRLEQLERALQTPSEINAGISQVLPADVFYLAVDYRKRNPEKASNWGPASRELNELCQKYPSEANWERLSSDFGGPHPAFMLISPTALVKMKAVSTFVGIPGWIYAESWNTNNLYWARLADEMGYSPVELNLLVPELTRNMIADIFASNIDDWPALLRAMEQTGNELRAGKIALHVAVATSTQ